LSGELSLTDVVLEYLTKELVTERVESLVSSGKSMVDSFVSLKRIDPDKAQALADVLRSCQERTLTSLGNSTQVDASLRIRWLHDQFAMLYLVLFSVYEKFYDRILSDVLLAYLKGSGLISTGLVSPLLSERGLTLEEALGIGRKPILGKYDFPLILRLLMASSTEMQERFGKSLGLGLEEARRKAIELSDNLIHSMTIRNRIAHMHEARGHYALERLDGNLQYLAYFYPRVLETLQELLTFFSSLQDDFPLDSRKPKGRLGLLYSIHGALEDGNPTKKLVATMISKLEEDKDKSNEDLVATSSGADSG